ncbi:MAG: hypothetical protein QXU98_13210 [Candidatus Parvarchaeota archaeon]
MSREVAFALEIIASITAIGGVIWRIGRKIIEGIEGVKAFAKSSTQQLDRIANSLDKFVEELELLKKRVSNLEQR